MRIRLHPADVGGCGMYRVIWPAQALAAQGADLEVIMPDDVDSDIVGGWTGEGVHRRLVEIVKPDCDVVVLQRPLQATLAQAVPLLQAHGIRVVVEIDDDFEAISPRNVSWRNVQPQYSPRRNRAHLLAACEAADLVVCSTPALAARYGRHGRVVVVPNCVPESYLAAERPSNPGVYVGWSGSIETHPDDLQVTGGGVGRAVKATGANFAVVGTGRGVRKALGLSMDPVACGWTTIEAYPTAVSQFDVGIVPLELTPFNAAKSALKLMEMAALGVAVVASPTPENMRMWQSDGIGVLADSPRAWEGTVKALIRDAAYRADVGGRSREAMAGHTIERNAERWLDAWSLVNTRVA